MSLKDTIQAMNNRYATVLNPMPERLVCLTARPDPEIPDA